ncbi:MAG: NAD(P)/FAD-dependent oxidoreductase [Chloroflexi bacterium]|nr:NAD(P)/FAD-dependent oxidoreductase [Chloroflexota bacterium]
MSENDVAIIGASSAGLFAGYLLAREGLPVRIYEASEGLNPAPRTLIVTGQLYRALGFTPNEAILNRVRHIELTSRNARARVSLGEPDLVIERGRLIRLLASKAEQAGARIELGRRFTGFQGNGDGLALSLLDLKKGRVELVKARALVGADGALSPVARAANRDSRPTVAIVQAKVALPPGAAADTVQVWFDRRDTRFFYWLIPESSTSAVAGLVGEGQEEARQRLDRFLGEHKLEASGYQAAQVPRYESGSQPWARVRGSGVFLVGDAAGQVKMTTVGGVVAGLRGAEAVANAILRQRDYGKELEGLKKELDLHHLIRRVLDRFCDTDYDVLLNSLDRRAMGLLKTHNRDEMARAFWGLVLAQPRWLVLAARSLLRRDRVG